MSYYNFGASAGSKYPIKPPGPPAWPLVDSLQTFEDFEDYARDAMDQAARVCHDLVKPYKAVWDLVKDWRAKGVQPTTAHYKELARLLKEYNKLCAQQFKEMGVPAPAEPSKPVAPPSPKVVTPEPKPKPKPGPKTPPVKAAGLPPAESVSWAVPAILGGLVVVGYFYFRS